MTKFDARYFQAFKFDSKQIDLCFQNACRDLEIAQKDKFSEVRFTYSYQALIKAGITLIAKAGQARVRSVPGHHVKILEKISEVLHDPDILTMGNAMRMKRNDNFYGGGSLVGEKEAADYLKFVELVIEKTRNFVHSSP